MSHHAGALAKFLEPRPEQNKQYSEEKQGNNITKVFLGGPNGGAIF